MAECECGKVTEGECVDCGQPICASCAGGTSLPRSDRYFVLPDGRRWMRIDAVCLESLDGETWQAFDGNIWELARQQRAVCTDRHGVPLHQISAERQFIARHLQMRWRQTNLGCLQVLAPGATVWRASVFVDSDHLRSVVPGVEEIPPDPWDDANYHPPLSISPFTKRSTSPTNPET